MPANVRSSFDRIVKGRGVDAFAPVVDRAPRAPGRTWKSSPSSTTSLLMGAFRGRRRSCASRAGSILLHLPERPSTGDGEESD